ncbi:MAG: four helix bundle protein [Vicinamibacterales bacterium]
MRREELESRTQDFGVAVYRLCRALRDLPGGRGPAGQLVDCATAIGANYRATSRSRSRAEFVAKMAVVVEEADEAVFWLEFFHRVGVPDSVSIERLLGEARELRAIFAAGWRTARRSGGRTPRR